MNAGSMPQVDHRSPCPSLEQLRAETRDNFKRVYDKVDDPENGLGAHSRAISNSTAWQERLEARVNQLWYLALATALSGVASIAVQLALRER